MLSKVFVLLLLWVPMVLAAIRFDIDGASSKCFAEYLNKHELAKGSYEIVGISNDGKSNVNFKITGPGERIEYQQSDSMGGKFGFTASESGEQSLCFENTGKVIRTVELSFTTGADTVDYDELVSKEHLKPIELELRKLEDRVENIHKEMMYQREREEIHRDTNESTNSRVAWFSILTIVIVLGQASVQVWYLYTFFKKRKFI